MHIPRALTLGSLSLLPMLLGHGSADAAMTARVQIDQRGDFTLIGNTLGHNCSVPAASVLVGTVGACGTNLTDTGIDVYWEADAPAGGEARADLSVGRADARSSSRLVLPAGASVTHAYLYWASSDTSAGAGASATLQHDGGPAQALAAAHTDAVVGSPAGYQSRADVTAFVQQQGQGVYRLGGVSLPVVANTTDHSAFAGWWMAVFYTVPGAPLRTFSLWDGLERVQSGAPQSVALSGFLVPQANQSGRLGVIAFEGDDSLTGDGLLLNGTALSDAENPANNFFNSSRSTAGVAQSLAGDLPQLSGTAGSLSGLDLDVVDITPQLLPGATSVQLQATSAGDSYLLGGFVTAISTFAPSFVGALKEALDVNGGAVTVGDELRYRITLENRGNDAALEVVLRDVLPAELEYVPGSLEIVNGPHAGGKTDASGDDQGEYDAATRMLVVRLGSNATATQGGRLAIGESSVVAFRARVIAAAGSTVGNVAQVTARGELGSPSQTVPTEAPGGGVTEVYVHGCDPALATTCGGPTPVCDAAATPHLCVECTLDAHCPGLTPSCNVATRSCECVPSGPEVCDGRDNNCDGQIDEGFPAQCAECTEDSHCGGTDSARVCHDTQQVCVDGCRGQGGNGCPAGLRCSSSDHLVGRCEAQPSSSSGGPGSSSGGSSSGDPTASSSSSSSGAQTDPPPGVTTDDEDVTALQGGACNATGQAAPWGWLGAGALGLLCAMRRPRRR